MSKIPSFPASAAGFPLTGLLPELQGKIVRHALDDTLAPRGDQEQKPLPTQKTAELMASLLRVNKQIHDIVSKEVDLDPELRALRDNVLKTPEQARYACAAKLLRTMDAYREQHLLGPATLHDSLPGKLLRKTSASYKEVLNGIKHDLKTRTHIGIDVRSVRPDCTGAVPEIRLQPGHRPIHESGNKPSPLTLRPTQIVAILGQLKDKTDLESLEINMGEFHALESVEGDKSARRAEKKKIQQAKHKVGAIFDKLAQIKENNPGLQTVTVKIGYQGVPENRKAPGLVKLRNKIEDGLRGLGYPNWLKIETNGREPANFVLDLP